MNTSSYPEGKTNRLFYLGFSSLMIAALFVLSGCAAFGHRRVPPDRFNYNEALAESSREQMLLNIIRLRYLEEPVFLAVSSILTQYVYNAGVEVGGLTLAEGLIRPQEERTFVMRSAPPSRTFQLRDANFQHTCFRLFLPNFSLRPPKRVGTSIYSWKLEYSVPALWRICHLEPFRPLEKLNSRHNSNVTLTSLSASNRIEKRDRRF
jgi:hypothetical protein